MRRSLWRVWRLRLLQEELGRIELESAVAGQRRLDERAVEAAAGARASRGRFFAGIDGADRGGVAGAGIAGSQEGEPAGEQWLIEEGLWRRAVLTRELGEAAAPEQALRVEEAGESFLARRRERREVESLLEAAANRARGEAEKRAQGELDDWFQRRRRSVPSGGPSDRQATSSPESGRGPGEGKEVERADRDRAGE